MTSDREPMLALVVSLLCCSTTAICGMPEPPRATVSQPASARLSPRAARGANPRRSRTIILVSMVTIAADSLAVSKANTIGASDAGAAQQPWIEQVKVALARPRLHHRPRLRREQAFTLHLLADELAGAPHRFRLFARLFLGRLLVVPAELHLAEDTLALHLLLQGAERLVDVVFPDKNLHGL